MSKPPIRLTREDLHAQIWATPVDVLAKTYGISGRGLGKICSAESGPSVSPLRTRGFWIRKAAR